MTINVTAANIRSAAYGLQVPAGEAVDASIDRLISKALARIYAAFPTIDKRIANQALDADVVQGVVEDMVIRVLRNPNAYRQVSIDDYMRQIDTAISSGHLYLTADERTLLAPRRRKQAVRSVRLHLPSWRLPGV